MTARRLMALVALASALAAGCGTDAGHGDGTPDAAGDASATDDAGADVGEDAPDTAAPDATDDTDPFACRADRLGETSADTPADLPLGQTVADLTLCDGESDWFRVEASADADVTVRVDAALDDDAIALELARDDRTADGDRVAGGVEATIGPGAGAVLVRVIAAPGTDHVYSIEASSAEDPTCPDRADEPNEDADGATPLDDRAEPVDTWICAGDEDWYRIELAAGEELVATLRFSHDEGDLELELLTDDGRQLDISESGDDDELVSSGPVEADGTLYVRVWGFRRASAAYQLELTRLADDTEPSSVSGSVVYEDRAYDTDGFTGSLPALPARQVVIEVTRAADGVVVADGVTDDEGRFALDLRARPGRDYVVRALAAVDTGVHTAVVRDRSRSSAVYSIASEPVPFEQLSAISFDLFAARSDAIGGAMNIADVVQEAFTFIERWVEPSAPELTIMWQPGMAFSCGSCYSRNTISLGGQLEDPDEYDDDIVLHEFGHYFVEHYSADTSPGGSHRDRQVQPELAYGEGLAYFFTGVVRDSPHIVDNFLDARRWIDMEAVTQNGEALPDLVGTTNGDLSGNHREEIVSGILWDAYDPATEEEPFDTLEIGADGHMRILLDYFGEGIPVDVGPRGIDISDWLNALVCDDRGSSSQAAAFSDDREFPWSPDDLDCDFKHGAQTPLRLERVQSRVTADGIAPTTLSVLVDRSSTLVKVDVVCESMPCIVADAVSDDAAVVAWSSDDTYHAASWIGDDALLRMLGGDLDDGRSRWGKVRHYPSR